MTFVVGKGGVGKTTCAAGIAIRLAAGQRTLLLSTDPAAALGAILGVHLDAGQRRTMARWPSLTIWQMDAGTMRREFLARWRDVLVTVVDRGTYLDVADVEGLIDAALPGGDEIFGVLALAELASTLRAAETSGAFERVVVDTAPTGHTLRLLTLPESFAAMVSLLETMQAKHRFMVSALTHRYQRDRADEFLEGMRQTIDGLRATLCDRTRTGAVVVTRSEPVVAAETARYIAALHAMHLHVAAVLVNAQPSTPNGVAREALDELLRSAAGAAVFQLPLLEPTPVGAQAIDALMAALKPAKSAPARRAISHMGVRKSLRTPRERKAFLFSGGAPRAASTLLRTLTITGGKGGVGKTTVSCALALVAADSASADERVLLVSTDPASSIGDALGMTDPRWASVAPEPVPGVTSLDAWQMDATNAFRALRERYQKRIEGLFSSLVGRGLDATHDRAILHDLLALAPPGIDELYALSSLGEALEDRRYSRIVVDPAPTGHLLRLLQMPALALEWTHRLMRLMLKYKEIGGLGEAAEDLISFSRHTRAFDARLHDSTPAGVVLVTLDEPMVQAETRRLELALRTLGVNATGVVCNRATPHTSPMRELARGLAVIDAPLSDAPLIGVAAIRDWCVAWRRRD